MHKQIYQDNLLRNILNHSLDAFIVVNNKMEVLEWNQNATNLFGWTADEAMGKSIKDLIIPKDYIKFHSRVHEDPASAYNNPRAHPILNRRIEVPAKCKNGKEIPIELTVIPVESGGELYFSASIRDLSKRYKDEEELKRRANLINLSRDGIYVVDEDHKISMWSDGASILYGYTSEEAIGEVSYKLLQTDFSSNNKESQEHFMEIIRDLMKNNTWEGEIIQMTKHGERVTVLSRWVVDVEKREVMVTNTNITQIKKHAEEVQYLATHDELTGLPNRRLLDDRLHQAIALSHRNNKVAGVMLLDLDRFKVINDSLGHDQGDNLLKEIGKRLIATVREDDTVARLGGDEFVVIVENVEDASSVGIVAQKIIDAIQKPIYLGNRMVNVGTSIGITVYPQDGTDISTLLRHADLAMYQAKAQEAGAYRFFDEEMNVKIQQRLEDEHDLRRAVENGEFYLKYMPKVCTIDGKTTGVEALIRWKHPLKGEINPGDFIPLAEEMGLISKIGEWALCTACAQAKQWQRDGKSHIQMSVNLSIQQLTPGIIGIVQKCLATTGLEAQYLDLEITESTAMNNVEDTIKTLHGIKELGVSLSIDDFGTGYSSLSYLKKMPLNCLKIDQSFVKGIPYDADDISIVKSIISLAHSMGLKVIAEGVTDREQVAFLDTMKCDEMQGYLFSKPEDKDTVGEDLIEHQWKYPYNMHLVSNTGSSVCSPDRDQKSQSGS